MLALAGPGYDWMNSVMPTKATNVKSTRFRIAAHFIPEQKPDIANSMLIEFLH